MGEHREPLDTGLMSRAQQPHESRRRCCERASGSHDDAACATMNTLFYGDNLNILREHKDGDCSPEASLIFVEALRNLERISDHADNLADSVLDR